MAHLSRRAFLALAALVSPLAGLRLRAQTAPPAVSLDEFLDLSRRLTGKAALDREAAATYLKALQADPALAGPLAQLARSSPGNSNPALENTIIEWWYTGVYSLNGQPRLAAYAGALMWGALGIPAAGTCAGPFGAWSRAPRARA